MKLSKMDAVDWPLNTVVLVDGYPVGRVIDVDIVEGTVKTSPAPNEISILKGTIDILLLDAKRGADDVRRIKDGLESLFHG